MEIIGVYYKNRMRHKYTALGRTQTFLVSGQPRVGSGPLQQQQQQQQQQISGPPHPSKDGRVKNLYTTPERKAQLQRDLGLISKG
jgi:hypothetical protein